MEKEHVEQAAIYAEVTVCASCNAPCSFWLCSRCEEEARRDYISLLGGESAVGSDYAPELFEQLAQLEPRSFWFRSRNRLLLWALGAYFPEATNLLEIGCGTGFVLSSVHSARPDLELAGAELFVEGLRIARTRLPDVPLVQADACTLNLQGAFDVVTAFDVLEHIQDDRAAIRGIASAVRPGGGVLIAVPQHRWLWSAADEFAGHQRRYERTDLLAKLVANGLEPLRATSFVSFLLPMMLLSRHSDRARAKEYDLRREFEIPVFVDRSLEAVMTLERLLIQRGASLPLGGSLLVVARRR